MTYLPAPIWIGLRNTLSDAFRRGAEIVLVNDPVLINDEGHDVGVAIGRRIGDQCEAAGCMAVDDIIPGAARARSCLVGLKFGNSIRKRAVVLRAGVPGLYPGAGNHGELAGVGALFCTFLRGDTRRGETISGCLSRQGLPRTPGDLGLSVAEFTKAVAHAPATRPGRFTILEHLGLDADATGERVEEYVRAVTG